MDLASFRLVSSELADSLILPATRGAAGGGLVWLLIFIAASLALGVIGLVVLRRRLARSGRPGRGLTLFVVAVPLVLGMALGAWVGFGFGAARGASAEIEAALNAVGERELHALLERAEQLAVAAGVPSDALDADMVAKIVDPYLLRLKEREAEAGLSERVPLLLERSALEAAVSFARSKVGERLSWRAIAEQAPELALTRLRGSTHALLAPVRHAGMPFAIAWAALVLAAHALAWWRAGKATSPPPTGAAKRPVTGLAPP